MTIRKNGINNGMLSKIKKLINDRIKRINKWLDGDQPKWLSGKGR